MVDQDCLKKARHNDQKSLQESQEEKLSLEFTFQLRMNKRSKWTKRVEIRFGKM